MMAQKLITHTINQDDQRYKTVQLTAAGSCVLANVNQLAENQVLNALTQLSSAEQQTVAQGLELYSRALKLASVQQQYLIRSIQDKDNHPMAVVIKNVLKEYGGNRPGTAYQDPEVEDLSTNFSMSWRKKLFVMLIKTLS